MSLLQRDWSNVKVLYILPNLLLRTYSCFKIKVVSLWLGYKFYLFKERLILSFLMLPVQVDIIS
jgi:hypothetical protein